MTEQLIQAMTILTILTAKQICILQNQFWSDQVTM